jgi:hypothetical protein
MRFFALRATTSLKIQGAFIPRRVFTQAGPKCDVLTGPAHVRFATSSGRALAAGRNMQGLFRRRAAREPRLVIEDGREPLLGLLRAPVDGRASPGSPAAARSIMRANSAVVKALSILCFSPALRALPLRGAQADLKQMAHGLGVRILTHGFRPTVNALCQVGGQPE